MPSHMDLLAQAVELDKRVDPEMPVMSLNKGDFSRVGKAPEVMNRSVSSPDLLARTGMLGDSRADLPESQDLRDIVRKHGGVETPNNARVAARIRADWHRERGITTHDRPLGNLPVSSDEPPPEASVALQEAYRELALKHADLREAHAELNANLAKAQAGQAPPAVVPVAAPAAPLEPPKPATPPVWRPQA